MSSITIVVAVNTGCKIITYLQVIKPVITCC